MSLIRKLRFPSSSSAVAIRSLRYVDADGVRKDVDSRRLVPTDKLPSRCKPGLSLREKKQKITKAPEDEIRSIDEERGTLNELFELYMSLKRD